MAAQLTQFERRVLSALAKIPRGNVVTYAQVAEKIGAPRAARAVGNALNKNPHLVTVACHRVVRSDGTIGGYRGGIAQKIKLLRGEGVVIIKNKINHLNNIRYEF